MPRVIRSLGVAALLWLAVRPGVGAEQVRPVQAGGDGRVVQALCTDGARRVVLLHGAGERAEVWNPVLARLAGEVGACAYQRPGTADDDGGADRGWFELLDEMRGAHVALDVEPGYVLVGYGVGGLYARLLVVDRPYDVGGLVLVEPAHEDFPTEARTGMPPDVWAAWMDERRRPNDDGVRETELARRARGTRLPDIPVTVLTGTVPPEGEGWNGRLVVEAARRVQASVLRGVRISRHVPATGSGTRVHVDAPDLVAEEIVRMVRMTSEGDR